MYPYTTPYHRFKLPILVDSLAKLYATYAIKGETIFEKELSDFEKLDEYTVRLHLSQTDTGLIGNDEDLVEVQITLLTTDGERMTSKIVKLSSGRILKDGEI